MLEYAFRTVTLGTITGILIPNISGFQSRIIYFDPKIKMFQSIEINSVHENKIKRVDDCDFKDEMKSMLFTYHKLTFDVMIYHKESSNYLSVSMRSIENLRSQFHDSEETKSYDTALNKSNVNEISIVKARSMFWSKNAPLRFLHYSFSNIVKSVFNEEMYELNINGTSAILSLHYPELKVSNIVEESIILKNVYVQVSFRVSYGTITLSHMEGFISTISYEHFLSHYAHSHLPTESYVTYGQFCLGESMLSGFIIDKFNKNITFNMINVLIYIEEFIKFEDMEANPYSFIASVNYSQFGSFGDSLDDTRHVNVMQEIIMQSSEPIINILSDGDTVHYEIDNDLMTSLIEKYFVNNPDLIYIDNKLIKDVTENEINKLKEKLHRYAEVATGALSDGEYSREEADEDEEYEPTIGITFKGEHINPEVYFDEKNFNIKKFAPNKQIINKTIGLISHNINELINDNKIEQHEKR